MAENTTNNKNVDEEKSNNHEKRRPMTAEEIALAKKRREVAIKRARQALSTATAEEKEEIFKKVHLDRKVEKPTTFKGKWDNFWYHYKLTVLLVVAVIGIGIWIAYDIINRKEYDLTIMVVTTDGYLTPPSDIDDFEKSISDYVKDFNSDGKKEVILSDLRVGENVDPMMLQGNIAKYTASIANVEDIIYIFNKESYDRCKEQGVVFEDLSKYSNNPDNPAIQGDKYSLKGDERFKKIVGYEDMYMVVRDIKTIGKTDEEITNKYNNAIEFIKNILN